MCAFCISLPLIFPLQNTFKNYVELVSYQMFALFLWFFNQQVIYARINLFASRLSVMLGPL